MQVCPFCQRECSSRQLLLGHLAELHLTAPLGGLPNAIAIASPVPLLAVDSIPPPAAAPPAYHATTRLTAEGAAPIGRPLPDYAPTPQQPPHYPPPPREVPHGVARGDPRGGQDAVPKELRTLYCGYLRADLGGAPPPLNVAVKDFFSQRFAPVRFVNHQFKLC